jgi:hypothetical protein
MIRVRERFRSLRLAWSHAFALPSAEGLTPEEAKLVEDAARFVVRKRLVLPCILFLETVRPLNFLGSQVLHGLVPCSGFFADVEFLRNLARLLEKRAAIDWLIEGIQREQGKIRR